ncbi:hypothetical protein BDM02DRAFT_3119957 [Thelephora ganbajun]|uniref:Uncharacterized protein n=1 Tax=Thelephora ganbajun TaxID=370292 RepID=A0ACB6Z8A2_THEGA|nr:hypothetical protein BDM02DRAFT_3119957 [Thelephora ganbajun]
MGGHFDMTRLAGHLYTTPDEPPPCSPRVIYSLASALDIKPLRDLAFDDIRSKVTSANVVTEPLSSFTSRCVQPNRNRRYRNVSSANDRQGCCENLVWLLYDNFNNNNNNNTENGVEFI